MDKREQTWVDFKMVKDTITMQMVLSHYGIDWLRKEGGELVGRCPIHSGEGTRTLHVSPSKNIFNCFSCKARGNVLDFVAAMERCSVRDAALALKEWFSISTGRGSAETRKTTRAASRGPVESKETVLENNPLTFELKGIDPAHPYLATRGITKETAERFGVGFFSGKGSMTGRIVIPIHNDRGHLVGYAGRAIDDSEPKYKFPSGFHKSLELFNLHRVIGEGNPDRLVVVVEGFFDCLQVTQAGFSSVALMGCSLSEAQEELLVKYFKSVWLMLDGDEAGQHAAIECVTRIGRRMWVRLAEVGDDKQPDQLTTEEIRSILEPLV